jgi:hypothetical protein
MFSDWIEVPTEWRTSLKAYLEQDPPLLGKVALGFTGTSNVPLEALASGGEIGNSGVGISVDAISLGGDVVLARHLSGVFDAMVDMIRMGASGDVQIRRPGPNFIDFLVDNFRFGATNAIQFISSPIDGHLEIRNDDIRFGFTSADVGFSRLGIDAIEFHDMGWFTYNEGGSVTPLHVNIGGTVFQIRVGAAGTGPSGSGRMLWVS